MTLRIYNTLTREKEDFVPVNPGKVGMYLCGPTVYKPAHIGHMVGPVIFDTIKKYLAYLSYDVTWIVNITDVDDKLINKANELGVDVSDLAQQMTQDYFENLATMGVDSIDRFPYATEHIPEMLAMIASLIEKGHAYPLDGDVYFQAENDDDYGKLSHRNINELVSGERVEAADRKKHPADFALWKASKPGEPSWDSPWGPGRPGWHIECSAMSMKYLGETLDIHGGGLDLLFPHHENELTQSESYTGKKPFARFWLHNGLLRLDGAKMSKSLGNLVTVRDALDSNSADAIRMYILTSHYRSPLLYDEDNIHTQERAARRLRQASTAESDGSSGESVDAAPFKDRYIEAMEDDLNTPQALAAIFDLAHEINRGRDAGHDLGDAQSELRSLASVLGLTLAEPTASEDGLSDEDIEAKIAGRAEARSNRDFAAADAIRDELVEAGVLIEDGPDGTTWSRI